MMEYRRLSGTIADNREKEGLKADVERQEAILEYIALAADVELPDDSESEGSTKDSTKMDSGPRRWLPPLCTMESSHLKSMRK